MSYGAACPAPQYTNYLVVERCCLVWETHLMRWNGYTIYILLLSTNGRGTRGAPKPWATFALATWWMIMATNPGTHKFPQNSVKRLNVEFEIHMNPCLRCTSCMLDVYWWWFDVIKVDSLNSVKGLHLIRGQAIQHLHWLTSFHRGQQRVKAMAVILWFCAFAQYQPGDEPGDRGGEGASRLYHGEDDGGFRCCFLKMWRISTTTCSCSSM